MAATWTWQKLQVAMSFLDSQGIVGDTQSVNIAPPYSLQRLIIRGSTSSYSSSYEVTAGRALGLGYFSLEVYTLEGGVALHTYYSETIPEVAGQILQPQATGAAVWSSSITSAWPFHYDADTRHGPRADGQPFALSFGVFYVPDTPLPATQYAKSHNLRLDVQYLVSNP